MNPALKVPPVAVLLFALALTWGLNHTGLMPEFRFGAERWVIGFTVILAGLIAALALFRFRKEGTTVNPHKPENTSGLVTGGIYMFSRNPMYLSLGILLLAYIFYLGHVFGFAALAFYVWYIQKFQILPEEQMMRSKFGEIYEEYCDHVRRWF